VHIKSTTYVVLKAKEKRCVLRRVLKIDSEEACLMCSGSLFHNFGAATENVRPPLSLILVLGNLRSSWSADLRDWLGV